MLIHSKGKQETLAIWQSRSSDEDEDRREQRTKKLYEGYLGGLIKLQVEKECQKAEEAAQRAAKAAKVTTGKKKAKKSNASH